MKMSSNATALVIACGSCEADEFYRSKSMTRTQAGGTGETMLVNVDLKRRG